MMHDEMNKFNYLTMVKIVASYLLIAENLISCCPEGFLFFFAVGGGSTFYYLFIINFFFYKNLYIAFMLRVLFP